MSSYQLEFIGSTAQNVFDPATQLSPHFKLIEHQTTGIAYSNDVDYNNNQGMVDLFGESWHQDLENDTAVEEQGKIQGYYRFVGTIPIRKVILDETNNLFLLSDTGALYYCGNNSKGQSGLGHQSPVDQLTMVREHGVKNVFVGYQSVFTLVSVDGDDNVTPSFVSNGVHGHGGFGSDVDVEREYQSTAMYMNGQNTYGTCPNTILPSVTYGTDVLRPVEFPLTSLLESYRNSCPVPVEIDPAERLIIASPCFSSCVFLSNRQKVYVSGQYYWFNGQTSGPCFGRVEVHGLEGGERIVLMTSGNFNCFMLTDSGNLFVGGQTSRYLVRGTSETELVGFHKADAIPGPFRHACCYKYLSILVTESNDVYYMLENDSQQLTERFRPQLLPDVQNWRKLMFENPMPQIHQCYLSYAQLMFVTEAGVLFCAPSGNSSSGERSNTNHQWFPQVRAQPHDKADLVQSSSTNAMNAYYRIIRSSQRSRHFISKLHQRLADGQLADVHFLFNQ